MVVSTVTEYQQLIGGAWVPSTSGQMTEVRSPATGKLVGRVARGTAEDVDRAVLAARAAFDDGRWRSLWIPERVAILNRLADLIEADMEALVALEVAQTGTALKFRRDNDMPFAPDNLRFFATAIRHLDGKAAGEYSTNHTSMVRREPIGVCGQISPWNYPFMMAIWKIGPALAAGNSVVLKPASATPLTTLRLGQLALDAGLPAGVLNVITGPGEVVGSAIAAHPDIDLVSLTGDTATGKKIAAQAAGNLKRLHLELGGKAPFIVYADADLDAAARGAVAGGYINAGQDCTAATRIYVERSAYEPFLDLLKGYADSVRVGDPEDPATDMGSLINDAQVLRVEGFVERAKASGARVISGGARAVVPGLEGGAFYQATVLADVEPGLRVRPAGDLRARSSRCSRSTPRQRSSRRPTTPGTGWPARSGRATCSSRCARLGPSTSVRCGSTTICPSPVRCPTAVSSSRATARTCRPTPLTSTPRSSTS